MRLTHLQNDIFFLSQRTIICFLILFFQAHNECIRFNPGGILDLYCNQMPSKPDLPMCTGRQLIYRYTVGTHTRGPIEMTTFSCRFDKRSLQECETFSTDSN